MAARNESEVTAWNKNLVRKEVVQVYAAGFGNEIVCKGT
jgi:hypothetical protein